MAAKRKALIDQACTTLRVTPRNDRFYCALLRGYGLVAKRFKLLSARIWKNLAYLILPVVSIYVALYAVENFNQAPALKTAEMPINLTMEAVFQERPGKKGFFGVEEHYKKAIPFYKMYNKEGIKITGFYFDKMSGDYPAGVLNNGDLYYDVNHPLSLPAGITTADSLEAGVKIVTKLHPLPRTEKKEVTPFEKMLDKIRKPNAIFLLSQVLIAWLAILPAESIMLHALERSCGAHAFQLYYGVSMVSIWIVDHVFEILLYLSRLLPIVGAIVIAQKVPYGTDWITLLVVLTANAVPSVISSSMIASFFPKNPSNGYIIVLCWNLLQAVAGYLSSTMPTVFPIPAPIGLFFPTVSVMRLWNRVIRNNMAHATCLVWKEMEPNLPCFIPQKARLPQPLLMGDNEVLVEVICMASSVIVLALVYFVYRGSILMYKVIKRKVKKPSTVADMGTATPAVVTSVPNGTTATTVSPIPPAPVAATVPQKPVATARRPPPPASTARLRYPVRNTVKPVRKGVKPGANNAVKVIKKPGKPIIAKGFATKGPATSTAIKPSTSPAINPVTSPAIRPVTSPENKPVTKPAAKPAIKLVTNPAIKPVTSPAIKPMTSPAINPVTSPAIKPVTSPAIKPVTSPANKPVTKPAAKPAIKLVTKPAINPVTSPAIKPAINPVNIPAIKPVTSPAIKPMTSRAIKPVTSPAIKPMTSPAIKPVTSRAIKPVTSPATKLPTTNGPANKPRPRQRAAGEQSEKAPMPAESDRKSKVFRRIKTTQKKGKASTSRSHVSTASTNRSHRSTASTRQSHMSTAAEPTSTGDPVRGFDIGDVDYGEEGSGIGMEDTNIDDDENREATSAMEAADDEPKGPVLLPGPPLEVNRKPLRKLPENMEDGYRNSITDIVTPLPTNPTPVQVFIAKPKYGKPIGLNMLAKTYELKSEFPSIFPCEKKGAPVVPKTCEAVKDANFSVYRGCTALIGSSASGKNTVLKMCTGEVKPTKGSVLVCGVDVEVENKKSRPLFGFSRQTSNELVPELTARQMLSFTAHLKGVPMRKNTDVVTALITLLRLSTSASTLCCKLTYGARRKVCLGMALIGNPEVLFLNSLTNGIDSNSKRYIIDALNNNKLRGQTMLITTNDEVVADELCDEFAVMKKGAVFEVADAKKAYLRIFSVCKPPKSQRNRRYHRANSSSISITKPRYRINQMALELNRLKVYTEIQ